MTRNYSIRSLLYSIPFFLLFTTHLPAQTGLWIFDTTVNPDSTPLEISGGGVFPGIDTFIVLDQTDPANLQVYNINRASGSVESTSTIPVNTPAFGLGHVIRGANNTAHSCFVDNFQLFATQSPDGLDWDKVLVTNQFTNFSSCDTAVDNGNVYIGACNFGLFAYGIFESTDNGQTWNLIKTIPNVRCAFSGGTRANFNMVDGNPIVFYMSGFLNGVDAVENSFEHLASADLLTTGRLETDDELIYEDEDSRDKIDEDSQGPPLAESYPAAQTTANGITVIPYFHRDSFTVRIAIIDPDNPAGAQVITLGPAPPFVLFFGITCAEGPEGIVNVMFPGGHYQIDPVTGEVRNLTNDAPFAGVTDGPVAASEDEFDDGLDDEQAEQDERLFSLAYGGSLNYAVFGNVNRNVPALSEWGLFVIASGFILLGALYLKRKARA